MQLKPKTALLSPGSQGAGVSQERGSGQECQTLEKSHGSPYRGWISVSWAIRRQQAEMALANKVYNLPPASTSGTRKAEGEVAISPARLALWKPFSKVQHTDRKVHKSIMSAHECNFHASSQNEHTQVCSAPSSTPKALHLPPPPNAFAHSDVEEMPVQCEVSWEPC